MSGPNTPLWEFDPSDGSKVTAGANNTLDTYAPTVGATSLITDDGTPLLIGTRNINGVAAVEHTTNSYLYNSGFTQAQPLTVYIVFQCDSPYDAKTEQYFLSSGSGEMVIGFLNRKLVIQSTTVLSSATENLDFAPHIITGVFNGASSIVRLDGNQVATGNVGTNGFSGFLTMGPFASTNSLIGRTGRYAIHAAAHTEAQMRAEEQFIAQKWLRSRPVVIRPVTPPRLSSGHLPITINQTLSVTSTQTATITTPAVRAKALTVTESQTATLLKSISKTLNVTETQTASLSRIVAYLRTLSVTSTQTPTMLRSISKTLSVTSNQTATMTRSIGKTLAATSTQTVSMVRSVGKTLSAVSTQTATLFKSISKTLSVTEAQTPAITPTFVSGGGTTTPQTLSVTSTQTADLTAEFVPASKGGIRPGQQFIESPDYERERREDLERRNQEALALLLLNA